jgi:DNA-binding transcriptional LysR family regulator
MDTELLRTFLVIAETHSFTLAGQRLGRTQSAVSQQVRRLEELLGRPVFDRASGSVHLTEHGERLMPHARQLLATEAAMLGAFDRSELRGTVTLGMSASFAPSLLSRCLPQFRALYPAATISLTLDESTVLHRLLQEGALDLAFLTEGTVPGLSGPVVWHEPLVWVAPLTAAVETERPLPVILWREGSRYREVVTDALAQAGVPSRTAVTTQGLGGMVAAVAAGFGVAALARSQVTPGLRVLAEEAGLPALPEMRIRLEHGVGERNSLRDRLEQHLLGLLLEGQRA